MSASINQEPYVLSGQQIDNIGGCVFSIEDCKSMVVIFESYKTHKI